MRCVNCFKEHEENLDICPHCGYYNGMEPKEPYMLYAGTILQGRYMVGEVLGFGGFGIIYKAYDMKLERIVAIKEYYPSGLVYRTPGTNEVVVFKGKKYKDYANGLTRFLAEARNATKFINNPNIIDIMEYFEENGTAYFVMELLVGLPLDKFLEQCGGVMSDQDAINIISAVGRALKDIHKAGFIHRDIAPDNIYMCDNGKIKLFDFGASRFSEDEDKNLTVILKPGYAPTEQYETVNKQGPWTDVYALGATMYRMIVGEKPDESTNRKTQDTVRSPHEINPEISENLSNAIMRAMAVQQHLRYQTVDDFINAIQSEKKVVSIETVKKRKKTFRWVGIAASLVVIATLVFIFTKDWKKQEAEATLPDATITLWYAIDDGKENNAGLEQAVKDFMGLYGNVTIEYQGIPVSEYATQLKEAIANGNAPTIYEVSGLDTSYDQNCVPMSGVVSQIDDGKAYFLSSNTYDAATRIPTSFVMPVVYVNTSMTTSADGGQFTDITANDGNCDYSIKPDWVEFYHNTVSISPADYMDGAIETFLQGNCEVYFGSSADLENVYETMTGKCEHLTIQASDVKCIPGDEWSIAKASSAQETVAKRLLAYLINDPTAQDYLYMQGEYGDKTKIPINKDAVETLISDDAQFYGKILEKVDEFRMR